MSTSSTIQTFVDYLFEKNSHITDEVRKKAEHCRQDYMAVTAAGAAKNREQWQAILDLLPDGNVQLIGYQKKVDSKTAALINGFNAHALELDDGQRFAMIHLGASIISAIHAANADHEISEEKYLMGIIMGYEAACRLAIAMQPSHKNCGFHAAGTCGTIGSAIGIAFALGINKCQMKQVLTCAAGSAAGMLEIQEQRSELKPYNVGRAAMDGLAAAYMGFTKFETPDDMLGGERGFFYTFSDNYHLEKLTEKTDYFEIDRVYFKPYASCRHSHSAVGAAIKLHDGLDIQNIENVLVETYKLGVKGHDHTEIQGTASAKLSTPYAVAAALLYGRADLTVFEPLDDRILDMAKKVRVVENAELTKECPQKRIAIVTIRLLDGAQRAARVNYAKGEPENPLSETEIEQKYDQLKQFMDQYRRPE